MNKITLILINRDLCKKEGYVLNYGVSEDFIRATFGDFDGFAYDTQTIACVLRKTICNYELYRVLDLSNNYNTDQAKINVVKRNAETQLEAEGFTIIQHCYSSGAAPLDIDYDAIKEHREILDLKQTWMKQVIQLQSESKQLSECICKKKQELHSLEYRLDEARTTFNLIKSLEERNSEEIDKLNETIFRYKAGKKCCEDIERKVDELNKEKIRLTSDINHICKTKKEKEELKKLWKAMIDTGIKITDIKSYMYKVALDKAIDDTKVVDSCC